MQQWLNQHQVQLPVQHQAIAPVGQVQPIAPAAPAQQPAIAPAAPQQGQQAIALAAPAQQGQAGAPAIPGQAVALWGSDGITDRYGNLLSEIDWVNTWRDDQAAVCCVCHVDGILLIGRSLSVASQYSQPQSIRACVPKHTCSRWHQNQ